MQNQTKPLTLKEAESATLEYSGSESAFTLTITGKFAPAQSGESYADTFGPRRNSLESVAGGPAGKLCFTEYRSYAMREKLSGLCIPKVRPKK